MLLSMLMLMGAFPVSSFAENEPETENSFEELSESPAYEEVSDEAPAVEDVAVSEDSTVEAPAAGEESFIEASEAEIYEPEETAAGASALEGPSGESPVPDETGTEDEMTEESEAVENDEGTEIAESAEAAAGAYAAADYIFPQNTVYLADILDAVQAHPKNNTTISVEPEGLVALSESTYKNKNRNSITLTAKDSFDFATLTIGKVTVTISCPEEPVELVDYGEDDPLKPETPVDAIWANDVLYLTGKMPGNAIVEANPVTVEIDGEYVIAAYDIEIYANANQQRKGKTWQPAGDKVQVHFFAEESEDAIHVYHLPDGSNTPELVDTVTAQDGWIEFDAEHFSTYGFSFFEDLFDHAENAIFDTSYADTVYENDEIILSGSLPRNAIIEAQRLDAAIGDQAALVAYDITIYQNSFFKELGIAWQPGDGAISVRLKSDALDAENVDVYHMEDADAEPELVGESLTVRDGSVTFAAESFSVYAVVPAPPYTPISTDVTSLADIVEGQGYSVAISRSGVNYMTGTAITTGQYAGEFTGSTSENDAETWYFESNGEAGKYYIYRLNGTDREYLFIYNDLNKMRLDGDSRTLFTVEETTNAAGTFYIYSRGTDSKNYALSVRGVRNFFLENRNNGAHAFERVVLKKVITGQNDPYGLDGKTYSIAYHEESVKGAGLMAQARNATSLEAVELLVRPDVLSGTGELLIAQDSELSDWTFKCIEGIKYYVTTQVGGTTYYLTLGSGLTLQATPSAGSVITMESGEGEYAGKYRFSVGSRALTQSAGRVTNGFLSSDSGGQYSWLNLVAKSALLDDDDFDIYSAEKVDLSDRTVVPDGAQVVVYSRVWNDSAKKYEFYAVNYDGSLVRCFESGDMIQWVGSTINTLLWDFTEYYEPGTTNPNYYYELQNAYNGSCIRPVNTGEFLRSSDVYTNPFDRSINLNGRRYGYYYSTILAWDNDSYGYIGLRVKDDRTGLEICPMSEADSFYFAIMKPVDILDHTSTVGTVDHTQYGITMKMVDLENGNSNHNGFMSQLLGSNSYTQTATDPGLLSTNLTNGYPTATKTGKSLSEMFVSAIPVNHLFIENTYYSSGYYEFDSNQNFASFYKEDGTYDPYNFTVYSQLASYDSGGTKHSLQHGQFFPYNYIKPGQFTTNNQYNLYPASVVNTNADQELPDSDPRKGEQLYNLECNGQHIDTYFAVEIEASFTQTTNGHDAWGHDIIYEFTGDDDFWLYVDGELIIDLGGIHGALAGSVNYCTGAVVVNGVSTDLRTLFTQNFTTRYQAEHGAMPSAAEINEFLADYFEEGETVFKDYSTHTMRIFYMERGAGASNLHMRFNLASVKPGTVELSKVITGVDSTESFMAEYPFQIFFKEQAVEGEPEPVEKQLIPGSSGANDITVKYKDTTRNVTHYSTFTAADGTTTYEHVYMLKPGETAVISFPDDTFEYRIVECFVNTDVYEKVYVNGTEITGTDVMNGENPVPRRKNYDCGYGEVLERTRVTYTNQVDLNAKGTLTFTKHLYEEDGITRIPHAHNDTTFTFRLYLGTENTPDAELPLADMYSYHVKDENNDYCVWASGRFVSLHKTDYSTLSDAEKLAATFTTSMNGTIASIPVDYTVEVREIPAGTKYMVEERDYELPDGYTLQWYVPYRENAVSGALEITDDSEWGKTPVSGIIPAGLGAMIEIRNLKGWGLRVNKNWSDADWMAERDPVYFAVYIDNGGTLTLEDNTVRQLSYGDASVYWFFEHLRENTAFDSYEVREVTLSGGTPSVNDKGLVTNAGALTVTPMPVDGSGVFTVAGRQIGETNPDSYTYKCVKYEKGALLPGSNVRVDTITNKRQGIDLYLTDWGGNALAGGTFTLTDSGGSPAGAGTFTSDSSGLITIAYLRENEDYTLTQTASPTGYQGLQTPLTIRRSGMTVTITEDASDWWTLDDTDIEAGENTRCGRVTVKNKLYSLQIKKTQRTADGEALPGATFALYKQVIGNNGQPRKDYQPISGYGNLVTDSNGLVPQITYDFAAGALLPGTYYLHETYPVSGYQPLSEDVVFTVSSNGSVTLVSHPDGVELTKADDSSGQMNTIYVPNQLEGTARLTVKKLIENGTSADTAGVNSFAFTVKLYLPDGLTTWQYTDSDFTNGTASFSLAHNGTRELTVPLGAVVTVTENANSNYTTNAALTVTTTGQTTDTTCSYNSNNLTSTVRVADETGTTLTYTNTRRTVQVNLKKTVEGSGGSFAFTAALTDGGSPCVSWTLNQSNSVVTDNAGSARITLTPAGNGSAQIALTVPYGAALTITEDQYSNYTTKVGGKETRTWTQTGITTANQTVTFTNTEGLAAPTNVAFFAAPFVWMGVIGILTAFAFRRKRQKGRA